MTAGPLTTGFIEGSSTSDVLRVGSILDSDGVLTFNEGVTPDSVFIGAREPVDADHELSISTHCSMTVALCETACMALFTRSS